MDNNISQDGFQTLEEYNGGAGDLLSLEGMIRNKIETEKTLKQKIDEKKEMLDNVLANDQTYQQNLELAKEATKVKNATKQEVFKRPDVAHVVEEMKELKQERKENKVLMSDVLVEYIRVGKQLALDFGDSEAYQIVQEAKIVKLLK